MKSILTTIAVLLMNLVALAQREGDYRLVRSIKVEATDLAVDNLGNLYALTPADQLKKYNAQGDSVGVYNETRRFGKLHSLVATNPLKLLLYYKDFATVVILDRQLSIKGIVDLRRHGITQASAIGLSYDNNIWVFDAVDNKLKKINEQGNLLSETVDLRTIFGAPFTPERILDQNNSVYLYDPAQGLYVFDHFGTLQRKLPVKAWQGIAVADKVIIGTDSTGVRTFNTTNLQEQQYPFPSTFGSFRGYLIANAQLFALSKDSINIYSLRF